MTGGRPVWSMVSAATSFPVVALLVAYVAAESLAGFGLFALFYAALPGLAATYFYRRGWISDIEVHDRRERGWLYLLSICFGIFGIGALFGQSGPLLRLGMVFTFLSALLYTVNRHWKISIHGASWGAGLAVMFALRPPLAVLMVPFVVPMAMSRFELDAHTPAQVVAGIAAGAGMAALIFFA